MEISPLAVFFSAFLVAACAGVATLLRSGQPLGFLKIISALLNSGLLGLGISLLWYTRYQDNVYFLIGVCVLAGLGGMTTLDFVLNAVKKGGFKISLGDEGVKIGEEKKDE